MPAYKDVERNNWFYEFKIKEKKYKKRGFPTKKEALIAESQAKSNLKVGKAATSFTFGDITESFLLKYKNKVKESTYYNNHKFIKKYFEPLYSEPIKNINMKFVQKNYLSFCNLNTSADYKNKIIRTFKNILDYGAKYYNLSSCLSEEIEKVKESKVKNEIQFWTKEEFDQFIEVVDSYDYKLFFTTLFYTGLRIGEIRALQKKDFKNNQLNINKIVNSKIKKGSDYITPPKTNSSNRLILLPNFLSKEIEVYLKSHKQNDFIFGQKTTFKETTIRRLHLMYCELSNVKKIRIHDFRHSHASYLFSLGADIIIVSKRLGHSNISETLNTYTHMLPNSQEKIIELMQ